MHLVEALVAGVRGAELGWAELYRRGTDQRATWYSSFEAESGTQNSTGANITLDSNGGAIVYVAELVNVLVKDASGTLVREFVAGVRDDAVEVVSPSFTGVDYDTGQSAANKPTTLSAVLDRWIDSAGAIDWKVLVGGASLTLQAAVSGNIYINVKVAPYNATGDGVTDDTAAINAALIAAQTAGGAGVYFPPGTYLISSTLNVKAGTSLLGTISSVIRRNSSNFSALTFENTANGTFHTVMLLAFRCNSSGSSQPMLSIPDDSTVEIQYCQFYEDLSTGIASATGMEAPVHNVDAGNVRFYQCLIFIRGADGCVSVRSGAGLLAETTMVGCSIFWLGNTVFINAGLTGIMRVSGNRFYVNCGTGAYPANGLLVPYVPSIISDNRFTTTLTAPDLILWVDDNHGTENGIIESGNTLDSIFSYAASTGFINAQSRINRRIAYVNNTAGTTTIIDTKNYGSVTVQATGAAGAYTLQFGTDDPKDGLVQIIFRNTTANAHTINTTNTSPADVGIAVAANQIARTYYQRLTLAGTTTWWRMAGWTVTAL